MDVRVEKKNSFFIKKAEHWRIWCFWTVVLEKTLESPLDSKEIKPVNPKGNQSWIFIGRTDAEAEGPILWLPDAKNSLEKTLMLGKIEGRRRGWQRMRWLDEINGHEFEQALGVGDGQGSLACCSPWGCKELDMTEQLNWTDAGMMAPVGESFVPLLTYPIFPHNFYSSYTLPIQFLPLWYPGFSPLPYSNKIDSIWPTTFPWRGSDYLIHLVLPFLGHLS